MYYVRFTDPFQKVMQLADQEAARLNHEYIGTEHILLGLVKGEFGIVYHVLRGLGVDVGVLRRDVERLAFPGSTAVTTDELPQTPAAKRAIEFSIDESKNIGHNYVGSEHILLGLLRDDESFAFTVLTSFGLTIQDVRQAVLNLLGKRPPDSTDLTG